MEKTLNPIEAMYESRPRRWWIYTLILLVMAALLGWSAGAIEFKGLAAKGSEVAYGIVYGIFHPDMDLLINGTTDGVPYLLFQTVAIAVLGTLFGGILAVPFSFLGSENIVPRWVAFFSRAFILLIRTIPSLVWALVWIRVTGPGAFCGVVTQSICSIGMISKMYINAIEDLDTRILESLDAAGCTTFQKIRYGILPQLYANFVSTIIYRFDINIKDATTLGIVGAGGIGASLIQCINSRRWSMVGAFLFGMIVLMLLIELFSTRIRKRLARG
jgi:phosphonate transport system permease protein